MKYLFFLLLATVIVFSCGDANEMNNDADTVTIETPATETPTVEAPAVEKSMLQSTVEAVKSAGGDITALPAGAAVSNIEGWIGKLRSMDGTDAIVGELNNLKTELTAGNIDGKKVSGILSSLAEQTRGMASKAPMLGTLASALQAGADKLGGR